MKRETLGATSSQSAASVSVKRSGTIDSGVEWIVDATGCVSGLLKDQTVLSELFDAIVSDLGLKVIGTPVWHQFPEPGGITGLALLSESHLACHTYPEFELLTLNLYCCRPRSAWLWEEELHRRVGAKHVRIRRIERGTSGEEVPT